MILITLIFAMIALYFYLSRVGHLARDPLDFARERDMTPGKKLHAKAARGLARFEDVYARATHAPTEALAVALRQHSASVVSRLNEIGMMLGNDLASEQTFRTHVAMVETYMLDREQEIRRLAKMPAPVLDNFPG